MNAIRWIPVWRSGMVVAMTMVDADQFDDLNQWTWHIKDGYGYVVRMGGGKRNQRKYRMHRVVMGATHGDGRQLDHLNRDKLDNRQSNLRFCTSAENAANRPPVKRRADWGHGDARTYWTQGCRCDPCKDATNSYRRDHRRRQLAAAL